MRRIWIALFVMSALAGLPAAAEEPASSISSLAATRAGNTITVSGTGTFVDASDAVVGTDPTGDALATGAGLDITKAEIRYEPGNQQLVFTLSIADEVQGVFTAPEAVTYMWYIYVTNGVSRARYEIQAMRSGQYGRMIPDPEPLLRVNSCDASCFEAIDYVDGTMGGGIIQWKVPLSTIGATTGSVITNDDRGILVAPSASGAAHSFGMTTLDEMVHKPYVVGPVAAMRVRRAGSGSDPQSYDVIATPGPDGTFVGKLKTPAVPGNYVVGARACYGLIAACGLATADLPIE